MNKNEILKLLKDFYNNQNLKFPEQIDITATKTGVGIDCVISLDTSLVIEKNMQEDYNAFEGWSIVIYIVFKNQYEKVTVTLCLKENNTDTESKKKHWERFLYRAQRFSEQYGWFELSNELKNELDRKKADFLRYIKEEHGQYLNNIPKGAAREKTKNNRESLIEAYLAEKIPLKEVIKDKNIFDGEEVYRQLPVGLFKGTVKDGNRVFPGSRAAIDLWSCKEDTFYVIELKASDSSQKSNKKVGIITEIFFYANYMRDLWLIIRMCGIKNRLKAT